MDFSPDSEAHLRPLRPDGVASGSLPGGLIPNEPSSAGDTSRAAAITLAAVLERRITRCLKRSCVARGLFRGRGTGRTRPDFDREARRGARRGLIREVAGTLQIQYDPRGTRLQLRDANSGQQVPDDADCFLGFQPPGCALFPAAVLQVEVDAIRAP
jgi:hypothetical protein